MPQIGMAAALVVLVGAAVIIAQGGAADDIARDAQDLQWAERVIVGGTALRSEAREGVLLAQIADFGLSGSSDIDLAAERIEAAASDLMSVVDSAEITGSDRVISAASPVHASAVALADALATLDAEAAVELGNQTLGPDLDELMAAAGELSERRLQDIVAVTRGMGTVTTAARYTSALLIPALVLFVLYRALRRTQAMSLLRRDLSRERELQHKKDSFIAAASHHIRTPLAAVLGFSEMLRDKQLSVDLRDELTDLLAAEARETSYIVDDLLLAARYDLTNLGMDEEEVDLRQVVKTAAGGVHSIGDVTIVGDAVALADKRWLTHSVRNLLRNAQAYGGDKIQVDVRHAFRWVLIEVSDNGESLPPGEDQKIFELYYSYQPDEGLQPSLGLGLAVAKRIARAMGGDLRYDRLDGRNVFELMIPNQTTAPSASQRSA